MSLPPFQDPRLQLALGKDMVLVQCTVDGTHDVIGGLNLERSKASWSAT